MIKVLLCDDEPEILRGLLFLLKEFEIEATTACSGNDAISEIAANKFDVIICDYLMSNGTGMDVLNYLEQNIELFPQNFIFFSAHINLIGLNNPNVTVVSKPDLKELFDILKQCLPKKREPQC